MRRIGVNVLPAKIPEAFVETVTDAADTAYRALTTGMNARQMVLTRDAKLDAAAAAADTLPVTLAQAAAEHAVLQAAIAAEAAARAAADTALGAKTVQWEIASYTLPVAVLLNGTATLTFTWETPLPTAPTKVRLLAPIAVTNINYGTPTTTGCTVTCKAGLAVAIGARFHLLAIRYA